MARNEAQTRFELIDPALIERGWIREDIRLEVTAAAIDIIHGRGQRRPAGRADYVLRRPLESGTEPRALPRAAPEMGLLTTGYKSGREYLRYYQDASIRAALEQIIRQRAS